MEGVPILSSPVFTLSLQPCDESLLKSNPSSTYSRKPPCSPPRYSKLTQDAGCFYPSPSKKRIQTTEKENNQPSLGPSNEIRLFPTSKTSETPNQVSRSGSSKRRRPATSDKKQLNYSFNHFSPQIIKPESKKKLNFSSFSPSKVWPENWKQKKFTPVLSEKKRKIIKIQEFCEKISLFDQTSNKTLISADTCSTFKDCSTKNEDSIIGEITPIKQEDLSRDETNDFTFNSPEVTLKYSSPPEELIRTPEASVKTPEVQTRSCFELLAPKKTNLELLTPESNVFVLSSSSELVSEVSLSEEISNFHDFSNQTLKFDKEMQTEADIARVLDLLSNEDILEGLKMIGKFKEIFRIINKN